MDSVIGKPYNQLPSVTISLCAPCIAYISKCMSLYTLYTCIVSKCMSFSCPSVFPSLSLFSLILFLSGLTGTLVKIEWYICVHYTGKVLGVTLATSKQGKPVVPTSASVGVVFANLPFHQATFAWSCFFFIFEWKAWAYHEIISESEVFCADEWSLMNSRSWERAALLEADRHDCGPGKSAFRVRLMWNFKMEMTSIKPLHFSIKLILHPVKHMQPVGLNLLALCLAVVINPP